jgi:hypothetical protein
MEWRGSSSGFLWGMRKVAEPTGWRPRDQRYDRLAGPTPLEGPAGLATGKSSLHRRPKSAATRNLLIDT